MSDYDKKWVKWVVLGTLIGCFIGKVIVTLLQLVVTNAAAYSFIKLITPGFAIIGLFIVLYFYNREKEDELGK